MIKTIIAVIIGLFIYDQTKKYILEFWKKLREKL